MRSENSIYRKRQAFYEAILGTGILVPEGEHDYEWLRLLQQLAESAAEAVDPLMHGPLSIIPTQDSEVAATFAEVARLRPDAVPMVDGDSEGERFLEKLSKLSAPPRFVIQLGSDAALECLVSWVFEPSLPNPSPALFHLLPDPNKRDLKALQCALSFGTNKKDRDLHENLCWESGDTPQCGQRAAEFLGDLSALVNGETPKGTEWREAHKNNLRVWVAEHIRKV